MRPIRTLIALALALAFCSVVARAQDQSSGDPVADAARKAREQKKVAPKPKKVFTDDDVKPAEQPAPVPAPSAGSPEAAGAAAAEKPEGAAAASAAKEDGNTEQAWRKRFSEQRRKVAAVEQELDVLQREAEKADLQYYSDPQKAMHEQFTRNEINEKNIKIEAKKKELADLKQQLSDMEDQLRASGGDPGWAR